MNVILNESQTVKLDSNGNGIAKMGPLSSRSIWYPQNVHVSCATTTKESQCSVYCGDLPIQQNFRDMSINGSSGDSSDRVNSSVLKCGQYVYAVWTGADANTMATCVVTGSKDI